MNVRPSISKRDIFEAEVLGETGVRGAAIPSRIREAIARHEAASEIIVGWIQLVGVALFIALYAASYRAFAVHSAFEPAPIALLAYAAFTAFRLRCAYERKLGARLQYLSVFADIGVLIALIWSFPFQYAAPFALYLKAPTLAYAFVLIALRALRFDPLQVWFAGGLAALGWAFLSVNAAAHGAEITWSYPHYMTSHAILPGAELEKIAAILAFTAVLALGVARSRALLLRTAREETAAKELSKFVGGDAAARIRDADTEVMAGDGERRFAAIMFIDLRGFTPATRGMSPEEVISLLKDFQERFVPIVQKGGGSIDKFLGDGILASFGAARQTARECAEALETALEVDVAAEQWRRSRLAQGFDALNVAVAIAAGDIVYGAVGAEDRLEYTVIGEAVNLAAKLEKHAKAEGARVIATGLALARAAAQGFEVEVLRRNGAATVDGVADPLDVAVLA